MGQGQQSCQKWKKSKKLFKSSRVDKNLRPPPAVAYEPVQKHKVTPGIPGWLNYISKISFKFPMGQWVNSMWPGNSIWYWRCCSTLVQVMACCLTAPSHYLNQCWLTKPLHCLYQSWLTFHKVLWHSLQIWCWSLLALVWTPIVTSLSIVFSYGGRGDRTDKY